MLRKKPLYVNNIYEISEENNYGDLETNLDDIYLIRYDCCSKKLYYCYSKIKNKMKVYMKSHSCNTFFDSRCWLKQNFNIEPYYEESPYKLSDEVLTSLLFKDNNFNIFKYLILSKKHSCSYYFLLTSKYLINLEHEIIFPPKKEWFKIKELTKLNMLYMKNSKMLFNHIHDEDNIDNIIFVRSMNIPQDDLETREYLQVLELLEKGSI